MSDLDKRLVEALDESEPKTSQIFKENKRTIWISALFALICIAASYYLFSSKAKQQKELMTFEALKNNVKTLDKKAFSDLMSFRVKFPELKGQIDNVLTKAYMVERDSEKAHSIMEENLALSSVLQPYYQNFSKTSFLMEKKQFGEALDEALRLKSNMLDDHTLWNHKKMNEHYGSQIFLFNLLRISSIYRELGKIDLEKSALDELLGYIANGQGGIDGELPLSAVQKFIGQFKNGSMTFVDFIESRQRVLQHHM